MSKSKYETIKVLGEGGYGKAVLVKSRSNEETYVMKEIRLSALKQKDRDEALQEAQVLASLHAPNIVEYVESFQERGCFYIVMEFADGGDLAQKIERCRRSLFSEAEVLHDFIQIFLAIKYTHDRKIIHRDLKAENVFLMKDGTVKLGDFGIARVLEHTFQLCRTQIGTPYYLSPEICEGKNYNSKTDIWSLGCILYELRTLKHPFDAANMNGLLMVIIRGRYQPIPMTYSKDLRGLLARMLTKDPSKRPSMNQVLGLAFIKARLTSFLDQTLLNYKMGHTILHGRKPFASPTIVLPSEKPSTPDPAAAAKLARRQKTPVPKRERSQQPDKIDLARIREAAQRRAAEEQQRRQREEEEAAAARRRQQEEEEKPPRSTASRERRRLLALKPKADVEDDGVDIDSILPSNRAKQRVPDAAEELLIGPLARSRVSIAPPVCAPPAVKEEAPTRKLIDPQIVRPANFNPIETGRKLEVQSQLAVSVQVALGLNPTSNEDDAEDGFETGQPTGFFIGDREVAFPVAHDAQSRQFRADEMRSLLRREIGNDQLTRLMGEIRNCDRSDDEPTPLCDSLPPGIVVLARHLFILEQERS
jgi:serine/threonine protein kinase